MQQYKVFASEFMHMNCNNFTYFGNLIYYFYFS
jgi:hypothetical protein